MIRRRALVLSIVLVGLLPAVAAADFGAATPLVDGQSAADDQALARDGTFASVTTVPTGTSRGAVRVLLRGRDGDVHGPRSVGLARGGHPSPARLALGSDGRVTVVWTQGRKIAAVRCSAGGCGRSLVIGRTGRRDGEPQVAADRGGRVLVLWRGRLASGPASDRDRLQWRLVTHGHFGPPHALGEFGSSIALGIDGQGRALAAWTGGDGVAGEGLRVATRDHGDFSAPVDLSAPGVPATGARIVAGGDGETILAWRACMAATATARRGGPVMVAIRPRGGPLGAPVMVSDPAAQAGDLRLARGTDGRAVLAWADYGPGDAGLTAGTESVMAALRPPGGVFAAPVPLTPAVDLEAEAPTQPLSAAVDDAGTATVAWVERGAPTLGAAPDTLNVSQATGDGPLGPVDTLVFGQLDAPLVSAAGRRTVLTFAAQQSRFAAESDG